MDVVVNGPNENAKDSGLRTVSIMGVTTKGRLIVETHAQDRVTEPVLLYFNKVTNTTTLNGAISLNARTIIVTSATGISVGSYIILKDITGLRLSEFFVTAVVTTTVTLDAPVDYAYPDGSIVDIAIVNMAVDGSSTEQVFGLRGTGTSEEINVAMHISRIIYECTTATAITLDKFGDLTKLTRGLLLRYNATIKKNLVNFKTNGEIAGAMFDWNPYESIRANQGIDGFVARFTFEKIGIVIDIEKDEDLEVWVQDNLSGITSFRMYAEGHFEE